MRGDSKMERQELTREQFIRDFTDFDFSDDFPAEERKRMEDDLLRLLPLYTQGIGEDDIRAEHTVGIYDDLVDRWQAGTLSFHFGAVAGLNDIEVASFAAYAILSMINAAEETEDARTVLNDRIWRPLYTDSQIWSVDDLPRQLFLARRHLDYERLASSYTRMGPELYDLSVVRAYVRMREAFHEPLSPDYRIGLAARAQAAGVRYDTFLRDEFYYKTETEEQIVQKALTELEDHLAKFEKEKFGPGSDEARRVADDFERRQGRLLPECDRWTYEELLAWSHELLTRLIPDDLCDFMLANAEVEGDCRTLPYEELLREAHPLVDLLYKRDLCELLTRYDAWPLLRDIVGCEGDLCIYGGMAGSDLLTFLRQQFPTRPSETGSGIAPQNVVEAFIRHVADQLTQVHVAQIVPVVTAEAVVVDSREEGWIVILPVDADLSVSPVSSDRPPLLAPVRLGEVAVVTVTRGRHERVVLRGLDTPGPIRLIWFRVRAMDLATELAAIRAQRPGSPGQVAPRPSGVAGRPGSPGRGSP